MLLPTMDLLHVTIGFAPNVSQELGVGSVSVRQGFEGAEKVEVEHTSVAIFR